MLFLLLLATLNGDPAHFVTELYTNAMAVGPDPVFSATSRADLRKTFDEPLADLIWRDLVDRQDEVGRMDAHYLFDAQDDSYENLVVKTLENQDGRARVLATFNLGNEKRAIEFHLRNTDAGWRIGNIVYGPDRNFADALKTDHPLPAIEDERAEQALCRLHHVELDDDENAIELAEAYANDGKYDEALQVLCAAPFLAQAERWSMLQHVLEMERGMTDEPLDFCEHATSRDAGIICAGRRDDEEGPDLDARYAAVRKTAGKSLDALKERADAFIQADAYWEGETYREGTMYAYAETHAELDRRESFIALLELHSAARAVSASAADWKRADAELNAVYRKHLDFHDDARDRQNLRAAQRAWIPYRDAWIAYYQERWRGAATADVLKREIGVKVMRMRIADLTLR